MAETKVMLITGAARRLGAALAEFFHHKGYELILHYRSSKKDICQLADKLNQKRPHSVQITQADFNSLEDFDGWLKKAVGKYSGIDVLINNASEFYPTKLGEIQPKQWYDLFASNAKAPLFLSQAALPYLKKRRGVIVNIADIHGISPLKDYTVYCMAKASLIMLTLSLAKECAPLVRVNAVAPGSIIWPEGAAQLSDAVASQLLQKIPLQKQGGTDCIAQGIEYLIQAEYATGKIIRVDGGRSLDIK